MSASIKRKSVASLSRQSQKKQKHQAEKNEDIQFVSYPFSIAEDSTITTPVVPTEIKRVLLDRFKEELLLKIDGKWNRRRKSISETTGDLNSDAETILRSRLVIGINQCTRILEKALKQKSRNNSTTAVSAEPQKHLLPSLIILTRDVRPCKMFSHIPVYAHLLQVPTLILPGQSSVEFGQMLGIKSVAAAMILGSQTKTSIKGFSEREVDVHNDIDSFVNFAVTKIPK